jgi:hypothetical protein
MKLLQGLVLLLWAASVSAGCSARGAFTVGAPAEEHPEVAEPPEHAGAAEAQLEAAELAAAAGAAQASHEGAEMRVAPSASGRYTLRWRPLAPEVPNNEPFELEFFLEKDGAPAPGAEVVVRGWMPDHGHGMVRRPEVLDRGDGSYLVRGMLLHMSGLWELFFDVYEPGARKDRVRFEIRL